MSSPRRSARKVAKAETPSSAQSNHGDPFKSSNNLTRRDVFLFVPNLIGMIFFALFFHYIYVYIYLNIQYTNSSPLLFEGAFFNRVYSYYTCWCISLLYAMASKILYDIIYHQLSSWCRWWCGSAIFWSEYVRGGKKI